MTTTQQESMSTGGSGKKQTITQIELGVLRDTVTVSLSKSTDPTANLIISFQSKTIILNAIRPGVGDSIQSGVRLRTIKRVKSKYSGVTEEEIELSQFDTNDDPPTIHECWAWDQIMHTMVVRFFQMWEKGTISDIYRGVAGKTKNIQASISGMIGGTLYNKDRAVDKDKKGRFYARNWDDIYPSVPRLPETGIHNAKMLAQSISKKKNSRRE